VVATATSRRISDFSTAADAVLEHLQKQCGLALWAVTRVEGAELTIARARHDGGYYQLAAGDRFRWCDTLCNRMVEALGPQVAYDMEKVPAYRDAAFASRMQIGAYVGVPLRNVDGQLHGTLFGIAPHPQSPGLEAWLPLIQLQADLLAAFIDRDSQLETERRAADRVRAMSTTDELTGVLNQHGWDAAAVTEGARCERYGHPVCVISVKLNGTRLDDGSAGALSDNVRREATRIICETVRSSDIVAHLSADALAVMAVECAEETGYALAERLREVLRISRIFATAAIAVRKVGGSIEETLRRAEQLMGTQTSANPDAAATFVHG